MNTSHTPFPFFFSGFSFFVTDLREISMIPKKPTEVVVGFGLGASAVRPVRRLVFRLGLGVDGRKGPWGGKGENLRNLENDVQMCVCIIHI